MTKESNSLVDLFRKLNVGRWIWNQPLICEVYRSVCEQDTKPLLACYNSTMIVLNGPIGFLKERVINHLQVSYQPTSSNYKVAWLMVDRSWLYTSVTVW